jgi:hypothetical protein
MGPPGICCENWQPCLVFSYRGLSASSWAQVWRSYWMNWMAMEFGATSVASDVLTMPVSENILSQLEVSRRDCR